MTELGKLVAIGGQWDEDGNAILYVTTEQPYIGMAQLEALQTILDAGVRHVRKSQAEASPAQGVQVIMGNAPPKIPPQTQNAPQGQVSPKTNGHEEAAKAETTYKNR